MTALYYIINSILDNKVCSLATNILILELLSVSIITQQIVYSQDDNSLLYYRVKLYVKLANTYTSL